MDINEKPTWKIWYRRYDLKSNSWVNMGVYYKEYKRYGYAIKVAKEIYGNTLYDWVVSQENPWRRTCDICGAHYLIGGHRTGNFAEVVYYDNHGLRTVVGINNLCSKCAQELAIHLNHIVSRGGIEE